MDHRPSSFNFDLVESSGENPEQENVVVPFFEGPAPLEVAEDPYSSIPDHIRDKVHKEALIKDVISEVIANEPRPEYREAMDQSSCFGQGWKEQDGSICTLLDCELRLVCEQIHNHVEYGYAFQYVNASFWQFHKEAIRPKKKFHPPRLRIYKKRTKSGKKTLAQQYATQPVPDEKLTRGKMLSRVPYVSTHRPVDILAEDLFQFFLKPRELPTEFRYGKGTTKALREIAQKDFVKKFGPGIWTVRRSTYHVYFFMGQHLCRFWVLAASGANCDLSESLGQFFIKNGIETALNDDKTQKARYQFFPLRIYIESMRKLAVVKNIIRQYPGLDHLPVKNNPAK